MRERGYLGFIIPHTLLLLRHPELGVLMCTKCYKSYGRGGWTKDGEGNDEYCRYVPQKPFFFRAHLYFISLFRVLMYFICFMLSGGAQKGDRSTFVTIALR